MSSGYGSHTDDNTYFPLAMAAIESAQYGVQLMMKAMTAKIVIFIMQRPCAMWHLEPLGMKRGGFTNL